MQKVMKIPFGMELDAFILELLGGVRKVKVNPASDTVFYDMIRVHPSLSMLYSITRGPVGGIHAQYFFPSSEPGHAWELMRWLTEYRNMSVNIKTDRVLVDDACCEISDEGITGALVRAACIAILDSGVDWPFREPRLKWRTSDSMGLTAMIIAEMENFKKKGVPADGTDYVGQIDNFKIMFAKYTDDDRDDLKDKLQITVTANDIFDNYDWMWTEIYGAVKMAFIKEKVLYSTGGAKGANFLTLVMDYRWPS